MNRWVLGAIFLASFSATAQQPHGGGADRGKGRPNGAGKPDAPASVEPVEADDEAQQSFDEMMGSFSDLAMKFSEEDSSDVDVFVYDCQHIGGKEFSRALEPFLTVNGEMSDCADSDLVIISDEKDNLDNLKKIAASIDKPVRQVLVSASIVEFQVTDGFEKDLSLQYNAFVDFASIPEGGGAGDASDFVSRMLDTIMPSGGNIDNLSGSSSFMQYDEGDQSIFSAFLTFLETQGTAKILSSPSLIMRRGHTGNIVSGEDIPITESNVGSGGTSFSVEYKSVGIKLRVTPESIFKDRVVLDVSPEVSNIIRYEDSAAGRNPVVAIRNASTVLEMNDGQMVSIGGLLREEKIETESRVPILGSIPFLGTLFRANTSEEIRSQLVIFLSVDIIDAATWSVDTVNVSEPAVELEDQLKSSLESMPQEKRSVIRDVRNLLK